MVKMARFKKIGRNELLASMGSRRTILRGKSNNLPVVFVGGIKEGSMTNIVPEVEVNVTEVGVHKGL